MYEISLLQFIKQQLITCKHAVPVLNKLSIYLNLTKNNVSQVTLDQPQLFKAAICFINLTLYQIMFLLSHSSIYLKCLCTPIYQTTPCQTYELQITPVYTVNTPLYTRV